VVVGLPVKVGRYEIVGRLATGGMAEILLARMTGPSGFERLSVVKRILPHLASTETFVAMFLDEARIVAKIRHSNVIQVQELGCDGEELFLAMEYLEGESVAGLLKRSTVRELPIEPALGAHIVAEACAGLHAAHELRDVDGTPHPIVHRDVSPQNIFVTYAGEVKVLDFGIAKAADRITRTEAGQIKGKFEYMSPEQCRAELVDRRSDIFALGTVLYELTLGRRLFKRASQAASITAITEEPLVPPTRVEEHYPLELEAVVLRALARDPNNRYATAAEMRKELLAAVRSLGTADSDSQEALALLMGTLFADRIREKQEMILRVRGGSSIMTVPASEVDDEVDVPAVPTAAALAASAEMGTEAASSLGPRIAKSRGRGRLLASAGVVLALGAALVLRLQSKPPVLAPAVLPSPALPVHPPDSASANASSAPIEERTVTFQVESRPPGAHVFIEGREEGTTPVSLALPQGERDVNVVLRARGFEPRAELLRANVNQHLLVTLLPTPVRAPARTIARPPASTPAPTPAPPPTVTSPPSEPFRKFN
jgi:hypothetical protein